MGNSSFRKEAFDLSICNLTWLVRFLQDTDGQFIGLSVARRLGFALENDMADLGTMKSVSSELGERLDLMKLLDHQYKICPVVKNLDGLSRCSD